MSPCTSDDDWSATFFAQTTPETLPRTTTCWPATIPVTLPCSPMMTSTAWTSPSISPSTCKVPRPMILSPCPMIFRSLPMTDLSPLEGALKCDCAPFARGRAVRRSIVLGSSVGLRWNMESPRGVVGRTAAKAAANTWWNCVVLSLSRAFHLELRTPADRTALVLYFSYELAARTGGGESLVSLARRTGSRGRGIARFPRGLQDVFG